MLNRLSSAVVPATPENLDPNRYSFLTLNNAEPNLGSAAGNNYILTSNVDGTRYLKQIGTILKAGQGIGITADGEISVQPNINLNIDVANITRTGVTRFDYTPSSPTKVFQGNDINSQPLEFTSNDTVFVYVDGFLLQPNEDYTVAVGTGVSNVRLAVDSFSDSIVSIVRFSPTLFAQGTGGGTGGNVIISGTIFASNVIEDGTTTTGNVFFTNTRAISALTAGQNIIIEANGLISGIVTAFSGNTDIIPEGVSNLYYTNARVLANLSSNPTTIVGNLIPSATVGRNLGNSTHKWNMSAQVFSIGSIYLKDISGNLIITNNVNSTTTTSISTSFIPEGSNLYYTNARALAAVQNNISTSFVTEGANLYFTNTRAISALTAGLNVTISPTGVIAADVTAGALPTIYTSNLVENGNTTSGNVYFTNARAIAALTGGTGISINSTGTVSVSGLTTTNVSEGTNQYFTTIRAREVIQQGTGISYETLTGTVSVSGLTTTDVSEGTRPYFTNTRAISALTAGQNIIIEANGLITSSATLSSLPTIYTSNIVENGTTTTGNVYFTNARTRAAFTFAPGMYFNASTGAVYANVVSVAGKTGQIVLSANDIVESGNTTSGNVYFTNTRAISAFTAGTGVAISNTGVISASLTGVSGGVIADIANTATLITGNLIPAAAGTYDLGSEAKPWRDVWLTGSTLNIGTLKLSQSATGGLLIRNSNVLQSGVPTFITDSVPEGPNLTSNLYFTNTRAIAAVKDTINTSNVLEGANLYFNNTRARAAISAGTGISYDNATGIVSSSVLSGGKLQGVIDASNVYEDGNTTSGNVFFNNARARAAFTMGNGITIADGTISANVKSVNGKTGVILLYTANIIESGTTTTGNVYFTNARARAAFTQGDNITITDGVIASTGGLQSADVGAAIPDSGVTAGRYGTNASVAAFIIGANGIISSAGNVAIDFPVTKVSGLTGDVKLYTANIIESGTTTTGNVYFTNARARTAISAGTGITYDTATGVISSDIISATDGTIRGKISATNANVTGTLGYGNIAYDSSTGVIAYTRVSNVDIKNALIAGTGISIEANGRIVNTFASATDGTIRGSISATSSNVTGTLGYGNLTYDSSSGLITYTRVSNVDIKNALKAGTGITIADDGTIATSATAYNDINARSAIGTNNANVAGKLGYGNIAYDSLTGVITYTRVSNADIQSALSAGSGIALDANGMITSTAISSAYISTTNANVTGTLGYGNLSYNSGTGVITYTRVSNADIKSALSGGSGIVLEANGQIVSTGVSSATVTGLISVVNANVVNKKGYGNLSYNNGAITFTRVSNADIVDAITAGAGITITANGLISSSSVVGTATNLQVSSLGVGTAASGTTGEIRATNDITAFYSSDRNLKTNITIISNALDKIDEISGVSFDWNDIALAMYPDRTYNDVGVIAQEIEAVLPQVVTTRDTGYKAVKYEKIIPLLIQAIKELKSEVDTLKQQINTK